MADLATLIDRLLERRVDFIIVGGYCAVAHGVSLLTQDLDICCRFTPTSLLRLQSAVADLHPNHRMTQQRIPLALDRRSCVGLKNLYLETDLGHLDCLGEVAGIGAYPAVRAASMVVDWSGRPCRLLTVAALIRAKRAMARPKDMETVRQLQRIERLKRSDRPS